MNKKRRLQYISGCPLYTRIVFRQDLIYTAQAGLELTVYPPLPPSALGPQVCARLKELFSCWMVGHVFNPSKRRQRQEDLCEFDDSQGCYTGKPCLKKKKDLFSPEKYISPEKQMRQKTKNECHMNTQYQTLLNTK